MKKLKYGQGSVKPRTKIRKDGSIYKYWQGRYYDETGTQRTVTAKTQEECRKKVLEHTKSKKKRNKTLTFNEWLQKWYSIYKEPNISAKTKESYNACMRHHISKKFSNLRINKITSLDVLECLNQIEQLRQRTITKQLICACLKQAYINNLTKINAFDNIKIPKKKTKQKNILKKEDETRFLNLISEKVKPAIICFLNTGCRLAELLEIKEEDLDRVNKTILIRGTKTKSSYRTIPMLPIVEDKLPLKYKSRTTIQQEVKKTSEQLGLGITVHDLRHTFATRCLEAGINMKTIQKWLGHSSYQVTADIYSHITTEFEHSEIEKLIR